MDISKLMKDEAVFIDLNVKTKEECIEAMIAGMEKAGFVSDKNAYLEAVNNREKTGSTGVGFGVAIPHGKSSGMAQAGLAFARLANPIEWKSLDDKPVSMAFMIGVPDKDASNEHLKILIAISKKLIHEDFRKKLMDVKSKEEVYSILESI